MRYFCSVQFVTSPPWGRDTTHTMSTPDLEAAPSADPGEYARLLKERVAPVLSEGLLLALRDRPTDPPAYLAEFLASKGSGVSAPAVVA